MMGTSPIFMKSGEWTTLNKGICEGLLIGGYTTRFAMLIGNRYFHYDKESNYVLFLENNDRFNDIGAVI